MSNKRTADVCTDIPSAKKPTMSKSGKDAGGAAGRVEIDENLHSRQLAVYGREAMKRMASSSVLISGMNGLGVEVAKNVILAGVKGVTVHDTATVGLPDLSAQFYLTEQDIGRNRAEACRDKLQELNTAVAVHAATGTMTDDFVRQHQVVVCTTAPLAEARRLDALCRAAGIAFIWAQTRGVFARVFTDFGPAFTVYDVNGEEPHAGIVASVSSGCPAMVTCVEDERLEFQDGELVSFSEVSGMRQLNTQGPFKVKNCKAHSFELDVDTSGWGEYTRGGIVVQAKEHKTLAFKPLQQLFETVCLASPQALAEPGELLLTDFSKMDRPGLLHVAFQALDAFEAEVGRAPRVADAAKLQALAEGVNAALPAAAKVECVDAAVVAQLAHCAATEISPMAAMFGGVVGQEVVKAVSGKFHPIFQWLYFDSLESLPDAAQLAAAGGGGADEYAPLGSRYDPQIAVFGRTMQRRLSTLKLFLVGAGALGCEFLKNLACMGVACDLPGGGAPAGLLTVTDDDVIEKSNLSRQFLFRDWDIGRSSPPPPPMCTVHSFPHNIDHCLTWARSGRSPPTPAPPPRPPPQGLLEKAPREAAAFLAAPADYGKAIRAPPPPSARQQLPPPPEVLLDNRAASFEQCITPPPLRFQEPPPHRIAQLTYTFPEDATTSTGAPFWSAPKRFPRPLVFDAADRAHASFVQAGAILRAEVYGIPRPDWAADASRVAAVLDWFSGRGLNAYSISCGPALLYNSIFPKHVERLGKRMSELVVTVAKMELPAHREHFDVVVACEDENDEDLDVPLVSIKFK
ncbi:Ubiquitin-activating enzyme E1 2 [Tetrabaena socialis]|uniref:Ubiquitin-like 1-activating enzyme E1A n=1 Tax=Tetrabaena socialis TaxID=47790 RepID=A0A2J8A8E6_9CHLO|nr:Ubiquitin-activating enzyme E1 2 [Tetrabaena socialis]|eukprot:PNH08804.1 Ubiquitin-activating enzyme E1 2 [Tetrabaena socialis]